MRILLICPSTETACSSPQEYPLGLLYLDAVLNKNHNVMVKNYYSENFAYALDALLGEIISFKPDIVGFNCMTMNRTACFNMTKIIKELEPSIKVILGGVHASSMYKQILDNLPVDIIVIGEGEQAIVDIADNKPLEDIFGIAYKDKESGLFVFNEKINQHITDLDSIPFPRHELFKEQIERTKCARMMTSRGCPYGCKYCSTSAYWGRRWRPRSAANVVAEIEDILVKMPFVEEIFFYDDTFTVDNQRVIDICDMLINKGIKLRLKCSARVDRVSREMLIKMKEAGFVDIAYGIESGSAKILEAMDKHITKEQIKYAVDLTNEVGLTWHGYMLVGFPGETWETINESVEFMKTLKNFDIDAVSPLEIYPNTKVYEMALEKGFNQNFWLTDQKVPHYTYEHSEEELRNMAFKIIYSNKINQGLIKFISFSLKYAYNNPKKTFNIIKRKIFKGHKLH